MGPAGGNWAFTLGEMGATEGLEERSDVTRLNALASVVTLASVWRMENRGNARTKMTSSEAITRREMMLVSSKVVAVGWRGVVGLWMYLEGRAGWIRYCTRWEILEKEASKVTLKFWTWTSGGGGGKRKRKRERKRENEWVN